jgi:HSP20 family protein
MNNDNYFENLAKGKIKVSDDTEENPMGNYEAVAADATAAAAEEDAETDAGDFEVELAKASTSAVASRPARTARAASGSSAKSSESKSADWEDGTEGQLTVDVYQTPETIVIESAIAGVKPEDIDVNVTSDSISIRGERHRESEVSEEDYLYRECYWGRFARSIILPQEVDPENADVAFKNGILTIRLPKVNKKKSKKLRVRID